MMFGSYTWEEERKGLDIKITKGTDYSKYTGQVFQFDHNINLFQTGRPNNTDMNNTYTVYNYETFTMLYSHRLEEDWMKAIHALSAMINYTSVQIRDQLILYKLHSDYFELNYKTEELFKSTKLYVFEFHPEIDYSIYHEFWIDEAFGFKDFDNILYWGRICENMDSPEYYFIHEYFTLSYGALDDFLSVIGEDWSETAILVDNYLSVGNDFSKEAKFYRQWASSEGTISIMDK